MNKYSAAFWGTSFVRDMTKLKTLEETPTEHEEGGQAELRMKREDLKGSTIVEGNVPVTPPVNAPAPANHA